MNVFEASIFMTPLAGIAGGVFGCADRCGGLHLLAAVVLGSVGGVLIYFLAVGVSLLFARASVLNSFQSLAGIGAVLAAVLAPFAALAVSVVMTRSLLA